MAKRGREASTKEEDSKAKRGREASTKEEDSTSTNQCSSIDRISMLPDELLVCILSFLTFKEATATSILSCRWRYLWTFTSKLDFDGLESILKVNHGEGNKKSLLDEERRKYIGWVNHVTKSHKATIEEFRVYFDLNKTHKKDIDQWLTYALARKVQRLELNLSDDGVCKILSYDECYPFPDELLPTEKQKVTICSGPWSMGGFNYLKKIIMCWVNVNGEALEFFLRNCPLLEHLFVAGSEKLSSLRVIAPFPSFKRLEIRFCHNINLVEIRDANLVYLKYCGRRIDFLLENVPLLVEIHLGGLLTDSLGDVISLFSSCLPQLEIFTLDRFFIAPCWLETEMFYSAVKMSNLKQLIVKEVFGREYPLLPFLPLTNLICASPNLQRFVFKPRHNPETVKRKVKKIARTYTCLKEVEFLGYRGSIYELELVLHFVENAVALEKIIIDPRIPSISLYDDRVRYVHKRKKTIEEEIAARTLAREQLTEKVPSRINLVIL